MPELELLEPQSFTKADWEGLFRALTADLDPWAFDLVALIGRFRAYVAERDLAFAVPGRMVLASSVLLRMKSDWVKDGGAPPTVEAAVEEVVAELAAEELPYIAPELRLPLRRAPRGRATVGDLGRALRAALASEQRRRTAAEPDFSPEDLGFALEEETFTDRAQRLLHVLLSLVNGKRVIPFREVTDEEPHAKVARLMELLHLDAQGRVRLFQEEFLGEILVEVPDGSQGPR